MKRIRRLEMVQIDLFAERVAVGESGKSGRGRLPRFTKVLKARRRKADPVASNQLVSRLRAAAQAD
jgi:hypothetical protein